MRQETSRNSLLTWNSVQNIENKLLELELESYHVKIPRIIQTKNGE